MLNKALHLCEAAFGLLHAYDGEPFRALAVGGVSGAEANPLREWCLTQAARWNKLWMAPEWFISRMWSIPRLTAPGWLRA
jgi:hypothetical protein